MSTFDGKVCVVTGGASGIGKATATHLAREGGLAVLADLADASDLAAEIGGTYIHTDTSDAAQGRTPDGANGDIERELTKLASPLGVTITAEQVADVIAFLASPAASAITGQAINVDGGMSAGFSNQLIEASLSSLDVATAAVTS